MTVRTAEFDKSLGVSFRRVIAADSRSEHVDGVAEVMGKCAGLLAIDLGRDAAAAVIRAMADKVQQVMPENPLP